MLFATTIRLLAISVLALCAVPVGAAEKRLDQDQVREAVNAGQIRPLDDVIAVAAKALPGEVIKVEVERRQGVLIYELKIISGQGRVREIKIDARSLAVLEIE